MLFYNNKTAIHDKNPVCAHIYILFVEWGTRSYEIKPASLNTMDLMHQKVGVFLYIFMPERDMAWIRH